jgi:hypothetical protein
MLVPLTGVREFATGVSWRTVCRNVTLASSYAFGEISLTRSPAVSCVENPKRSGHCSVKTAVNQLIELGAEVT